MKKLITILTLALVTACPLASRAQNSIESDPSYLPIDKVLDLKAIPPQVNVNLPRFLLKDALSGITNLPNSSFAGGDLQDLLKDVKLIRVVVLEVSHTNRPAVEKAVKTLQSELDSKWTSIVSIPDKKSSVGIYAMGDLSGESVAGVAVLVADEGDVVIVNIVGHVSIGKLMKFAMSSNKFPKELLSQFQGMNGGQTLKSSSKTDHDSTTNQPVETLEGKPKEAAKSESSSK